MVAWYYHQLRPGCWLLGLDYKIIVRPPLIIWGVLIKTWHFQGYFTPSLDSGGRIGMTTGTTGTTGTTETGTGATTPTDYLCFIRSCALCHCEQDKNIGMKECSRLWEIPGILLRHINTHLRILSIVKKPNRGLEPINLELMNLSLSPPTGYHLGTTCSWPIASRCRFAMGFCKHSYLAKTSANPGLLCTRIHKHRHLHCLGNFKCFNGCFVIMSGETERFIQR